MSMFILYDELPAPVFIAKQSWTGLIRIKHLSIIIIFNKIYKNNIFIYYTLWWFKVYLNMNICVLNYKNKVTLYFKVSLLHILRVRVRLKTYSYRCAYNIMLLILWLCFYIV